MKLVILAGVTVFSTFTTGFVIGFGLGKKYIKSKSSLAEGLKTNSKKLQKSKQKIEKVKEVLEYLRVDLTCVLANEQHKKQIRRLGHILRDIQDFQNEIEGE